jgi:hypothetical protein
VRPEVDAWLCAGLAGLVRLAHQAGCLPKYGVMRRMR